MGCCQTRNFRYSPEAKAALRRAYKQYFVEVAEEAERLRLEQKSDVISQRNVERAVERLREGQSGSSRDRPILHPVGSALVGAIVAALIRSCSG